MTCEVSIGFIVIVACKDESFSNLSQKGKRFFGEMGSTEIYKLEYRQSFAFIGIFGRNNEAYEKRSPDTKHKVSVTMLFKFVAGIALSEKTNIDAVKDL